MPQCECCGKEVDLPFECKFCGGYYCLEHRLPESHNCPNLPPRTPLGSWQTKKDIATTHLEEKTREFISEGELHFIREATPETRSSRKTRYVKSVVISILAIACLVLLFVYVVPHLTNLGPKRFSFNEEIRNFPITKTAVTFTGWKFTKELVYGEASEGNVFVVINYTVRNIGDTKMDWRDLYEFMTAKAPILQYGNYYAEAETFGVVWHFYGLPISSELMPNQTIDGFLYYEILEGYQPKQLLFPNKDSPSIIIEMGS